MTYQEKAKELIDKLKKQFITVEGCNDGGNPCILRTKMFHNSAKECAIIAVDEILKNGNLYDDFTALTTDCEPEQTYKFWQQVKNELTK